MNYTRIALASLGAFVAYMALGGLMFAAIPSLKAEFLRYPAVYRTHEGQMSHMPSGMAAMLLSMVVLAVLYARMYKGGSGFVEGAIFGAMIGLFVIGALVVHNYVNLNIGLKITMFSAAAFFIEWTVVGVAIGLVYKPIR
jgi:hypothetical protein